MDNMLRKGRKALTLLLASSLILLSPGLGCYEALAQVVRLPSGSASAPIGIPGPAGVAAGSDFTVSRVIQNFGLSPTRSLLPAPAVQPLSPSKISPAGRSEIPAGRQAPAAARAILQDGAGALSRTSTAKEQKSVLDSVYTGSRRTASPAEDVAVSVPERLSGSGLNASPRAIEARAAPAPVSPPAVADPVNKKAMIGMFAQRTLSLGGFIIMGMVYSHLAIAAVGTAGYGMLMVLGAVVAAATGPLNGRLVKQFSAKKFMTFTTVVRTVATVAIPVLVVLGMMNFWTLLAYSLVNGWVSSAIMTSEGVYIKRFSGSQVGTFNTLCSCNYMSLQMGLGLIFKVGRFFDKLPMLPFYIAALFNVLGILPIVWKMLPGDPAQPRQAGAGAGGMAAIRAQIGDAWSYVRNHWKEALVRAVGYGKTWWKEGLLFAAGLGAYFLTQSRLPVAVALLFWICRTSGFKNLWSKSGLRGGLVYLMLAAFIGDPTQYFTLPLIAESLGGAAGKSELLGMLMGAFFFGRLISNSSQVKLPLIGKVSGQHLLQVGVLGLAAAWSLTGIFPGSWIAMAGVVAVSGLLMKLSGYLTDKGWIKFLGIGLAFVALPFFVWGNIPVLFMSVLMMGFFFGPAGTALMGYFLKNTPQADQEKIIGVQQAAYNTAVAMGYGIFGLFPSMFHPLFPGMLVPLAVVFALVGVAFWLAPRFMPGLPEKSFVTGADAKKKA